VEETEREKERKREKGEAHFMWLKAKRDGEENGFGKNQRFINRITWN